MQTHAWLGDMCDEVFKVELHTGNTMIIPTGWIHAVVSILRFIPRSSCDTHAPSQYTPIDTLVFGGNFLHSYNVATRKWFTRAFTALYIQTIIVSHRAPGSRDRNRNTRPQEVPLPLLHQVRYPYASKH